MALEPRAFPQGQPQGAGPGPLCARSEPQGTITISETLWASCHSAMSPRWVPMSPSSCLLPQVSLAEAPGAAGTAGLLTPHSLDMDPLQFQDRQRDTMGAETLLSPVTAGQPALVQEGAARGGEGRAMFGGVHVEKSRVSQS